MRYRAFISYSHADSRTAMWLHRALENYHPPKTVAQSLPTDRARLTPIFLDREELPASGDLSATIMAALDDAEFLIVVCSAAAAQSHWVGEEVLYFKRQGGADRVLCVLADGDPIQPQTIFPEACLFQVTDGKLDPNAPLEPLAADLRPGEDRQRALIQVAATLLDVRFDDLMQRESHRRQRFLFKVASAATAGMLLTLGLAIFAFVQRHESQLQRQIAEREAATASRVTRTLTTLIQDTFTELIRASAEEHQNGPNLFIRSALANTAQVVSARLADEGRASAEALNVQGAIEQLLGDLQAAEDHWLTALQNADPQTQGELLFEVQLNLAKLYGLRNNPQKGAERIDQAAEILATHPIAIEQQLNYLLVRAQNSAAQGDYETANQRFEAVADFLQNMDALAILERLDAYNSLSVHYNQQKRLDDALLWANRAIDLAQANLPDDSYELIAPHNAAGWAYRSLRDYDKSLHHLQIALQLAQANFGSQHPLVADAHNAMGAIAYSQLDMAAAAQHFQASLDITLQLYGAAHLNVAGAHSNLATVLMELGQMHDALSHYRTSIDIARGLQARGGRALALALRNLARVQEALGLWDAALQSYRQAVDVRARVFGEDSQVTLEAMIHLSNLLSRRGQHDEAAHLFATAMHTMGAGVPADDPGLLSWSYAGWRIAQAEGDMARARQLLADFIVDSGERRNYAYIGDTRFNTQMAQLCLQDNDLQCATQYWQQGKTGLPGSAPTHPHALYHAAMGIVLKRRQGQAVAAQAEAEKLRTQILQLYPARDDLLALLDGGAS